MVSQGFTGGPHVVEGTVPGQVLIGGCGTLMEAYFVDSRGRKILDGDIS